MATTTALFADPQVVLPNVSWETYERLLEDLSDCSVPHLTYDRGELEIMSPTQEHEELNRTINSIVETIAVELELRIRVLGSSTFKRKDLKQGFEPDSCFYIKSAERIRGKKRLDLSVDQPPDLVVAIDISSSSVPRMPIFANFGVPRFGDMTKFASNVEASGNEITSDRKLAFLLTPASWDFPKEPGMGRPSPPGEGDTRVTGNR
jgi:Uma2 family endonuclease